MLRWWGNSCANHTQKPSSMQTMSLTNVSQVEIHCVGLQAGVAVYVQREGDAVLLFFVRAVGILTGHPWSISVQLTWDLVLVPEVETDRWVSNGALEDVGRSSALIIVASPLGLHQEHSCSGPNSRSRPRAVKGTIVVLCRAMDVTWRSRVRVHTLHPFQTSFATPPLQGHSSDFCDFLANFTVLLLPSSIIIYHLPLEDFFSRITVLLPRSSWIMIWVWFRYCPLERLWHV